MLSQNQRMPQRLIAVYVYEFLWWTLKTVHDRWFCGHFKIHFGITYYFKFLLPLEQTFVQNVTTELVYSRSYIDSTIRHWTSCITCRRLSHFRFLFGTGTIIPLFQIFGTLPRVKHLLNRKHNICNKALLLNTSAGMSSIPIDLFDFKRRMTSSASEICISLCIIDGVSAIDVVFFFVYRIEQCLKVIFPFIKNLARFGSYTTNCSNNFHRINFLLSCPIPILPISFQNKFGFVATKLSISTCFWSI